MKMDDYVSTNRDRWDDLVEIHAKSDFYDLEGFRKGGLRLTDYEVEEVGDVTGKSLLHLQCHFGMDTMSWSRLGASTVGADFSEEAVELGNKLAKELDLDARFVCSDIDSLPDNLDERFDIVYTSNGVLHWLPDLNRWAEVIAHFLKPGGMFYITEVHPVAQIFDDKEPTDDPRLGYPYFHRKDPMMFLPKATYADFEAKVDHPLEFAWIHHMGEIVTSLIQQGLRIDFLKERPTANEGRPFLHRKEDGYWHLKREDGEIPLTFSLKATKRA
jgi:SAM-dependent methyltransferase